MTHDSSDSASRQCVTTHDLYVCVPRLMTHSCVCHNSSLMTHVSFVGVPWLSFFFSDLQQRQQEVQTQLRSSAEVCASNLPPLVPPPV
mmetsp:Transcript_1801/g.2463  ORF Transcript_1801/g.2463 Transcript_1801/m.2463 type:complete len:88 (-) Transcript_1801:1064-1327(-)